MRKNVPLYLQKFTKQEKAQTVTKIALVFVRELEAKDIELHET